MCVCVGGGVMARLNKTRSVSEDCVGGEKKRKDVWGRQTKRERGGPARSGDRFCQ